MQHQETPSEIYLKMLSVIRFCCKPLGVDIVAKDYKINIKTVLVMLAMFLYYVFSAHTISRYIANDWKILLDIFAPVSCNTQGLAKFLSAVCYPKLYRHLTLELGEIYEKYQVMGQKYEEKLLEWNKGMKKILVAIAIVYSMTALLVLSTPLVLYIFKGEKHLVFLCEVPGFEVTTPLGYWVTNGFNGVCVLIATFGLYAGDLYLLLFLTHSMFFFDIFALKVSDLHELLEQDAKKERITEVVAEIVEWHQYYLQYIANDWKILLDIFAPVSCTTQGLVKFISAVCYPKLYRRLTLELGEIYEKYQGMGQKYVAKLLEWNKSMKKILVAVAIIYSMTALLVLSTPLFLYIFKGEKHLVFLCEVPGFEVTTPIGYWVTNGFNGVCVLIAAFGLYAGDLYLLLFLTHSMFFYDIFALKVSDLHELLEQNAKEKRITELVGEIVQWHQYYLQFNSTCNVIFFWTISVHIICTTLGILSTLLIIMLSDWPGAYVYICVLFLWLYMYCILGTRVELCNDKFCKGIYDINWYALDVSNQNVIRLMLLQSQVPRDIMIAGVEPLSVNTALKITKTIYSLVMMVLRFQRN